MTPYLVAPPVDLPVEIAELEAYCRVGAGIETGVFEALRAAAVGHLDGWSGVLGRAIMPQTWAVDLPTSGLYALPMPDVTVATVDYGAGASPLDVRIEACGPSVEISGAGKVAFTCALPASKLPTAKLIIQMLVEYWRANRGAVNAGGVPAVLPLHANDLISSLRWGRV